MESAASAREDEGAGHLLDHYDAFQVASPALSASASSPGLSTVAAAPAHAQTNGWGGVRETAVQVGEKRRREEEAVDLKGPSTAHTVDVDDSVDEEEAQLVDVTAEEDEEEEAADDEVKQSETVAESRAEPPMQAEAVTADVRTRMERDDGDDGEEEDEEVPLNVDDEPDDPTI